MLAIIVPYYKRTFFEDTLKSLAHQTDKRFKVYIGDDASPEDCSSLLEAYKGTFDFVYKRFEANIGGSSLVKQWERCISLIGDEQWIMILGDDDFIGPNLVSAFYSHFDAFNTKTSVVRFAKQLIFEKTKTVGEVQLHPVWEKASDSYYSRLTGLTTSSLSEYAFTKETYQKHGFFDYPLAWHSDDRAWLEFSDGQPIYTINEAIVTVRSSFINISGKSDNREQKSQVVVTFFWFLVKEKQHLFDKKQCIRIMREYENAIRRVRAFTAKDALRLLPFYIKNFETSTFIAFVKRSVKSIIGKP